MIDLAGAPPSAYARMLRLIEEGARERAGEPGALDLVRADPSRIMRASGMTPEPWQVRTMESVRRQMMLLCSRQSGKSTVTASVALRTAMLSPHSTTLLVAPSKRQSDELYRRMMQLYDGCGRPVEKANDMTSQLHLANGSRVIPLPGKHDTLVCFTADLLVIDEAARVSDGLYYDVCPMLIRTKGRLVALSTPYGKRGWFYDSWVSSEDWERVRVTAPECDYIPAEDLEKARQMGARYYNQNYLCSFEDAVGAVFANDDILAAFDDSVEPLFASKATDIIGDGSW